MYAHHITNVKDNPLPIRDGESIACTGNSPSSRNSRQAWNSLSGEAKALLKQLAHRNTGLWSCYWQFRGTGEVETYQHPSHPHSQYMHEDIAA